MRKHTCVVLVSDTMCGYPSLSLDWYVPGLWEWAAAKMEGHVCGEPAIGSDSIDDTEIFMCAQHYTRWFKTGYRESIFGER